MTDPKQIDLLIVDDDVDFRRALGARFIRDGFQVHEAADAQEVMNLAQRREFDVAVLDLLLPGATGLRLLEQFKRSHADCEVIMLTGQGSIETAVEAMKLGAYDFLTKPFPVKNLEGLILKAFERRQLKKENRQWRALLRRTQMEDVMIGQSSAMQEVFRLIERAGPSDKAILIQGESGTGKELVARALHRHSYRAEKPIVVINCAALPESLLESELFGHERGAFTGALSAKPGLFEVADGGTLFIDEIGELPTSLQAKLLRVLEDGSLRRIGSIKERRVDVRLLAASNRDLVKQVAEKGFREDLFYRINVMSLELPPLRKRREDISLLIGHFVGSDWVLEDDVLSVLERYDWPGNVRQLINAVERAKIMADGQCLRLRDFPRETLLGGACPSSSKTQEIDDLATLERAKVVEVLGRESGNKTHAARILGIDRRKLYRLIDKYGITTAELVAEENPSVRQRVR